VLSAPVGTVKWRVAEATKRLRVQMSEGEEDARTREEGGKDEALRPVRSR